MPGPVCRTGAQRAISPHPGNVRVIEGIIETLTAEGNFTGWLRDTLSAEPALLEIRVAQQTVARAVAQDFRADLLAAGQGHGHYGFSARLAMALPPGPTLFDLYVPRQDAALRARLVVPALPPPQPAPVEALLRRAAGWNAAHLLAHPGALLLPSHCAALGVPRFVDAMFRFTLNRWPSDAESEVYTALLARGALTPDGLLAELLTSRERADLPDTLPAPWDAQFPFLLHPAKQPA